MQQNQQHGLTLVEMLVYVAVLVLVFGVLIQSFLTLSEAYLTIRIEQKLHAAGLSVVDRLNADLRGGIVLDDVNSVYDVHPGKLSMTTAVATTTTSVHEIYVENGRVVVDVDTVREGPLTPDDITVTDLVFERIDTINSVAVRYDVTLAYATASATTSMTLHNTIVMRGTYQ